jgi:hypothetical protein
VTGFGVDPDLLVGHAAERGFAADRFAGTAGLVPVPAEAYGLIGRVFAGGVSRAAADGVEAVAGVVRQFRHTAGLLTDAADGYRAADAAAIGGLGAAVSGR